MPTYRDADMLTQRDAEQLDGRVISHSAGAGRCEGSGQPPAGDLTLASWLPVLPGLTPHGLRHGHQTWMDEDRIADVLKSERMGHEVPGMRGVYSHVSDAMRAKLEGEGVGAHAGHARSNGHIEEEAHRKHPSGARRARA